jgi:uncharacterized repeat protein (TIGR04052 family)
MSTNLSPLCTALCTLGLLAAACDGDAVGASPPSDAGVDAGPPGDSLTIRFAARVGASPVSCAGSFDGLGPDGTQSISFSDFRLYVHGVELLRADGTAVPFVLDDESPWQAEGVALLDFEDATGNCRSGTAPTRDVIRGRVPPGDYTGLRFVLGVPFALNHRDASTARAPLNLSAMFWGWQNGYKFLRIDAKSGTAGYFVHLASTGCDGSPMGGVTRCMAPNRPTITLDGFDSARDVVVADVARLVDGVDLQANAGGAAPGCMSDPTDTDCGAVFASVGLDFGTSVAAQDFFTVGSP